MAFARPGMTASGSLPYAHTMTVGETMIKAQNHNVFRMAATAPYAVAMASPAPHFWRIQS